MERIFRRSYAYNNYENDDDENNEKIKNNDNRRHTQHFLPINIHYCPIHLSKLVFKKKSFFNTAF